jgi:hypothetical protein
VWFNGPYEASGIAIDLKSRVLILVSAGNAAVYPFDQVREWEAKRVEACQVVAVGTGVAGAMQVGGHNAGAMIRALRQSGLFIRVRDVENPVWQIHMYKQPMLNRWFEILNQALADQVATG